jgi:hypothetical protein
MLSGITKGSLRRGENIGENTDGLCLPLNIRNGKEGERKEGAIC